MLQRRHDDTYDPVRKLTAETRAELLAAGPPKWSIEQRRSLIRELLVHEDKLTTERIHALYTLQGFLFASYGFVVRIGFPLPVPLRVMGTIIAVVGLTAARFYLQELSFNTAAITHLLHEWNELRELFPTMSYPSILGFVGKKTKPGGPKWLPRRTIPLLFMSVWIVAVGVAWWT